MADEPVPTRTDTGVSVVASLVGKLPVIGEALGIVVKDTYKRRAAAAETTVAEIAEHSGGVERLSERLAADPVLEALFVDAIDGAARTGMESKRRLFGRVVGAAVLDDAKVDDSQLKVKALRELDVPHIRYLEAVRRAYDSVPDVPQGVTNYERQDVLREATKDIPAPVRAALASAGVLEVNKDFFGSSNIVAGVTPFARALLDELKAEGLQQ